MDLADLKNRIDKARAEMEKPLEPGESRPVMPVTAYLEEADYERVWTAVRALRQDHPEAFYYFPEATLADEIIFALGEMDKAPTLAELAHLLEQGAQGQGPWLVSTPLANIALPKPWLPVADKVVLQRGYSSPEPSDDEYNELAEADAEIFRYLGDRLTPTTRWLRRGAHEANALDTTRAASLLTVEEGTRPLASSRARAKAFYAIAVWTLSHPPDQMGTLPDVGIHNPQPFIQTPQRTKEYDPGEWISKKRPNVGSIYHWTAYEVPDQPLLGLPFEAIAQIEKKRSAQALLSASWAIFEAARGSRFLLTERLRHVLVAVETLGEPRPGKTMKWKRWERISRRFGAQQRMRARGYTEGEIERAEQRLKDARNIATHGSDAALIDLGYPKGQQRALKFGGPMPSADLGFAALSADLTLLIAEVQHVLDQLLTHMSQHQWDDQELERQFKP
jgi:hypothetical protein